jgi:hypothetical protein
MRYLVPLWHPPLTQKSMQIPRQMLEPVHLGCHIISLGSKKLPQPVQETLGIRRLQIFNLRPRSSVDQHFIFRGPVPCVVSTASLRPKRALFTVLVLGSRGHCSLRPKRALFTVLVLGVSGSRLITFATTRSSTSSPFATVMFLTHAGVIRDPSMPPVSILETTNSVLPCFVASTLRGLGFMFRVQGSGFRVQGSRSNLCCCAWSQVPCTVCRFMSRTGVQECTGETRGKIKNNESRNVNDLRAGK